MSERKELILHTIIREHIKTGMPVGSGVLVDKYKLDISPATVRNEMADLESEGYIIQPHTSAGRVPTEKAYREYVEQLAEKKLAEQEISALREMLASRDEHDRKQAAKLIAGLSNNGVFWAFHKHHIYYTGVSNLLNQPEFIHNGLVYDVSIVIDRLDEVISEVFDRFEPGITVSIGSENPFSNFCSSILLKYNDGESVGIVGVIGPMRMNYEKNLAIAKLMEKEINIKK